MSLKVKLFIIGFTLESQERERKGKSACVWGCVWKREKEREGAETFFWQKKKFYFQCPQFFFELKTKDLKG